MQTVLGRSRSVFLPFFAWLAACSPPSSSTDAGADAAPIDGDTPVSDDCLDGDGAPSGPWLRCAGGSGIDRALSVATSAEGDVVVGGNLGPSPRIGGRTLSITEGFPQDAFLARYDRRGRLLWAHTFGSEYDPGQENSEAVFSLAVDGTGHIAALGRLVADADCGDGVILGRPPAPLGTPEMYTFVARFSPDGTCLWSHRLDDYAVFNPMDVGVDNDGNIYLNDGSVYAPDGTAIRTSSSTSFYGGVDLAVHADGSASYLGRGSGLAGMTILGHTFERNPSEYVFQLGPDGTPRWVREMPATGGYDVTLYLVSAGPNGEARVHGWMGPGVSLDFGGDVTVSATSAQQGFAVEYDHDGQPLRAFVVGGGGFDPFGRRAAFAADGAVVTTGAFQGSITLEPGNTLVASSPDAWEAYFASFGPDGRMRWVERLISPDPMNDFINTTYVTVDALGDVVLVGTTRQGFDWAGQSVPRLGESGPFGLETAYIAKAPGMR